MQVPKLDKMIQRKTEEIQRLRLMAEGVSGSKQQEKVGTSKTAGKMENAILQYIQKESELQEDLKKLEAKKRDVIDTIERLDFDLYDIVSMKYLNVDKITGEYVGLSIQEIADRKGKSYSWVSKMHMVAMRQLNVILENRK